MTLCFCSICMLYSFILSVAAKSLFLLLSLIYGLSVTLCCSPTVQTAPIRAIEATGPSPIHRSVINSMQLGRAMGWQPTRRSPHRVAERLGDTRLPHPPSPLTHSRFAEDPREVPAPGRPLSRLLTRAASSLQLAEPRCALPDSPGQAIPLSPPPPGISACRGAGTGWGQPKARGIALPAASELELELEVGRERGEPRPGGVGTGCAILPADGKLSWLLGLGCQMTFQNDFQERLGLFLVGLDWWS